ncbi:ATP synthase-coupling factor 6, mitochondrial [Phlebotomus argentipes]|uniref:ATP synthase-coupling factor 6, mitochondrial n=1 Tax=Phlebotomus argentipes TaxID=94469 RepID=UPI002892DDFC|nr:ATP synthase-coupling factor 6, mitochondrial [Phlebotomus argentipes]
MLTKGFTGIVRKGAFVARNFGVSAPASQKATDPIQQLFLKKVQEYKSKESGGKLVDATPEVERDLKTELDRVSKQFGGGSGVDMTKFPEFKFPAVTVDPINSTN